MKTNQNIVAVKPDWSHKQFHQFSNGDQIQLETKYNENLRERNQQLGFVAADNESLGLKKGDKVVVQHFQFMDHSGNVAESVLKVDGEPIAFCPSWEIYYKVEDGKMVPLGEFLIAKEIPVGQLTTSLDLQLTDLSEPLMEEVKVEIVAVNAENKLDLRVGDCVYLLEKYCKYKIQHEGVEYLRIRDEEIVGVITE